MVSKHTGLEYWVKNLSRTELPAMSHITSELEKLFQSDGSSATELAELILRDAALTSRILQVANSVHYNPNVNKPIATVSRAVVLLGVSGIKSILLTTMLVEHVLKGGGKERVLKCLAKALHAATQAKSLINHVLDSDDEVFEEVFISALIYHVSEIAFWGRRDAVVKEMDKRLGKNHYSDVALERELLGTSFHNISGEIVKQWRLGENFNDIFNASKNPSKRTQAIILADEISIASEHGWDSPAAEDAIKKAATFINLNPDDTLVLLKDRAMRAVDLASQYGADEVSELIPSSFQNKATILSAPPERLGDPQIQLQILHEINSISKETFNINNFFNLLLEGVHRGIGMERVGIFIVDVPTDLATLKYTVSRKGKVWKKDMQVSIVEKPNNYFFSCIDQRKNIWIKVDAEKHKLSSVNINSIQFVNEESAMITCIYAGDKPIAIVIADRGDSDNEAVSFQFNSFCHFSKQATQALSDIVAKA